MKFSNLIFILALSACQGTIDGTTSDMGDAGSQNDTATKDTSQAEDVSRDTNQRPDVTSDVVEDDVGQAVVDQHVIIGESAGTLSSFDYNPATGEMTLLDSDASAGNLSFAAFHPQTPTRIYTSGPTIRSYSYTSTGEIGFLSEGAIPNNATHLEVDDTGSVLISVSYGGGTISLSPMNGQNEVMDAVQTLGTGDAAFCQNAHQVRFSPENTFAYVPCLGNDHVQILSVDLGNQTMASVGTADVPANAGPRHMDFHPTEPWVYVLNETASSVSVFSRDAGTGLLTAIETVSTLPIGVTGGSASSDVHVSPDGRHLYAVNRQPRHEMAVFSINGDGTLTSVEHVGGMGEHSRSFALDSAGRFLVMGNRNTNNVVTFSRDDQGGGLTFVNDDGNFPGQPMFVGFLDL